MMDIVVRQIRKAYAKSAVNVIDGISFKAQAGKITSLLGPSGCGKTTTLRCVAGLESMDEGEILFGDRVVSMRRDIVVPAAKRNLGMVFQSYALWPHLSVHDNLAFGLKARGWSRSRIDQRVAEILSLIGLSGSDRRYPAQLSGGQQQRVALGRALAYEPQILLMDEPLANLDANLRDQMRVEIRRLQEQTGVTMLYVTHDRLEATALSDQMIVLNQGSIVQMGPPAELNDAPTNGFVARFLGHSNFIPVDKWDALPDGAFAIETPLGACIVAPGRWINGREYELFVQPRGISLLPAGGTPPEGMLSGSGRVLGIEKGKSGLTCRVEIVGTALDVALQEGGSLPGSGEVGVFIDPSLCTLMPRE